MIPDVQPVTFLADDTRSVEADVTDDGRVLVAPERLADAIGWELKPEGLCRDGMCVPVALPGDEPPDVAAVAKALGRPVVVDGAAGVVAMALDAEARRQALGALRAPPFTLADLDGAPHALDEWRGRKKLLVAFASW